MRAVAALHGPMVTRMSKLTSGDVLALTTFFGSPLTEGYRAAIAAQSYEPRGSGYQPSTDTRLAKLVFQGVRHGKSEWARMKRVVDQLSDAHVELLRVVCLSGRIEIARRMPRALEAGRRIAADKYRTLHLEDAMTYAQHRQLSPMTVAMHVLEADRTFVFRVERLSRMELLNHAHRAINDGIVDVDAEVDALIDAAADAYHLAVAAAAEWKRAAARREEQRTADFRASLRATREAKESARFQRRLLPKAS